jgi:hypothetical protein
VDEEEEEEKEENVYLVCVLAPPERREEGGTGMDIAGSDGHHHIAVRIRPPQNRVWPDVCFSIPLF